MGAVGEEVNVDELGNIDWEEDNNDSEEEFEANYKIDDENDNGDLIDNLAVQNEADAIDGLMACKPSVTQPNPTDPTTECCNAVSNADLQCLCSYKNSVELPFLGIDPDLAISLPAKCNLQTPVGC
ncbi:hypothetical protein Ahy_B03g066192 [Arachis hypogaea]|uniref:Bifunctional inhibitor/plant lipid transfer protein/seed storage helical domain-containing protein n=1 Tax=Arachis hypogaea TaxID=3818 RepID=A0A445A3E1_ARAHY|nr:hypothetical protein Ahy_B03g066192 [Arachis hypogaea]